MHARSCFITLTYADNPVTLVRRDVTLFFKSLRNAGYRFSYFGCGEYGEETLRPHYHIILFGLDFSHDRYPWKRSKKGSLLYRSPTLEKHWEHGNCDIGELTPESAKYCAQYTTKKINGSLAAEADEETGLRPYDRLLPDDTLFEVEKEMLFVSRNPSIGLRWFLKYGAEIYPCDFVVMAGREYRPPKYYDELMKKYRPDIWEGILETRLEHVSENPLTEERRASVCEARQSRRQLKEGKRNAH